MKNILFCTTALVFCLFYTSVSAQQAILTPILSSDVNFRDLAGISASNGGTGFVNTNMDNQAIRTRVFYRSMVLSMSSLTSADKETLSMLHIGLVIDLRTTSEINADPDWLPNGADYLNVNIYGTDEPEPISTSSPEAAVTDFKRTYQKFVTNEDQRGQFYKVLIALADESDAALFHCTGGKDRTGWTAMLLQSIAGVSSSTIMDDYLASNSYMSSIINDYLNKYPAYLWPTIKVMLGVQSEFLQAGLDQVTASYGSLDAYLTEGVGLSQETISRLRNKIVYSHSVAPALMLLLQ